MLQGSVATIPKFHIHEIGHFGDVLPSQSLGKVLKTKSNTTKANMHL